MNCIRCGRTIAEGSLLCPICSGMEAQLDPRPQQTPAERSAFHKRRAKKQKKPEAPAQRRQRRALVCVCVACALLTCGVGALIYLYFSSSSDSDAQQAQNQMIIIRQQNDYEAASIALANAQEQLETAKATIAQQNSQLSVLQSQLDGMEMDELTQILARENENLSMQVEQDRIRIDALSKSVEELNSTMSLYLTENRFYTRNVVFIQKGERVYHTYGCELLDANGDWRPARLNTEEVEDYTPCPECIG